MDAFTKTEKATQAAFKAARQSSPWRVERQGMGYTNYAYVVRGHDAYKETCKVIAGNGMVLSCALNSFDEAQMVANAMNAGATLIDLRTFFGDKGN